MDIKHLRYFVGIADAGSLMKAAERLHVAQPALSVHLSNLEAELGVQLVERSSRGIRLNENGRMLYERAVAILRYHGEAIMALKQRKIAPSGTVTIGMPSSMPELIAPRLHAAMRAELPDVNLYLIDASSSALFDWLQAGKIDFALLFNLPENVGLVTTPLFIDDFCLVGQFASDEAYGTIDFERVFDYPLVVTSRTTAWRKILEDEAAKRNRSFSIQFETESFIASRAIAVAGQAYPILPWSSIMADCINGRVQVRRLVNPDMRGVLSIAHLDNQLLTVAQQAVHDVFLRIVKDIQATYQLDLVGSAPFETRKVCPNSLFAKPAFRPAGGFDRDELLPTALVP